MVAELAVEDGEAEVEAALPLVEGFGSTGVAAAAAAWSGAERA